MSDRDVLQLLKMVRTAEHKLRPRGLVPRQGEGQAARQEGRFTRGCGENERRDAPAQLPPRQANGQAPVPPSTLPNSTVRPRLRPIATAGRRHGAAAAQAVPAAAPHMHHERAGAGRLRHAAAATDAAGLRCSVGTPSSTVHAARAHEFALAAARVCAAAATASSAARRRMARSKAPLNLRSVRWAAEPPSLMDQFSLRRRISRSRRHRRTMRRRSPMQATARIRRSTGSTSCRRRCRRRWASTACAVPPPHPEAHEPNPLVAAWRRSRCRRPAIVSASPVVRNAAAEPDVRAGAPAPAPPRHHADRTAMARTGHQTARATG